MQSVIFASLAALALAAPVVEKRQAATPPAGVNDATILQYALTLEHLENTFYREGLAKFGPKDFKLNGFYNNLKEIQFDEQTHVDFLTAGLKAAGATPVAECTYDFGITDADSFLAVAYLLEGVGVSAYLGAAQYIKSPAYLEAAGSILTVEARHSGYLRFSQPRRLSPFPSPFDVPLDFDQVFSLAAQFIKSCPSGPSSSLEVLKGFQAFPAITAKPAGITNTGMEVQLTTAKPVEAHDAWFITSVGATKVTSFACHGPSSYTITVPQIGVPNLSPDTVNAGAGYLVLTKDSNKPTDDNVVAGPAVLELAVPKPPQYKPVPASEH